MDPDWILMIAYACVAIGFSFYCSVAEAVLLSISPSFIATMKEAKPQAAERLEKLKANIDRPLAAILSLNTIAHTIGAAGVGAQAASIYSGEGGKGGEMAVAIASGVMTLLILVFSEIIPKTIGALYWRRLGPIVGVTVNWLIVVLYPLVWISEQITKVLSGGKGHHTLTREELGAMAEIGAQQGVLEEGESQVFRSMMRFPQITVSDIMTPRVVVIGFQEDMTVGEILEKHPDLPVSRVPIYKSKLDDASGFVLRMDLLLAKSNGQEDRKVTEFKRDLATITSDASAKSALENLLKDKLHIAMVVDQYGSAVGIVTLEDVIETLLGLEIVDEKDAQVDMQKFARDQWMERAKKTGLEIPAIES